MRGLPPRFKLALYGGLLALLLGSVAQAHFLLNINLRVIHVQHLDDGVRIFLRLPLAYVLAQRLGPEQADGSRTPAPYTRNRMEDGQLIHIVDGDALRADPFGLGRLIADGHHITVESRELPAEVEFVRAYPAIEQPPFATLDEALRSVAEDEPAYPLHAEDIYVGDTVADVVLRVRADGPMPNYSLSSSLNPGLPGQEDTANLILDYYPGETLIFRERGLLGKPLQVMRSPFSAALTFIQEGVKHILEGLDHVLFVLCLIIGAVSFGDLLLRVTGFTVGHTITLIAGFLGFAPQGEWFVPAVETGIALSIIYAAIIAVTGKTKAATLWITAAIGLLHGLGFSFVLHEILRIDAPNLWQSLLSFNLGVEIGQLAIVVLIWPLFWLLGRRSQRWLHAGQWVVALPCIVIATYWTSQRAMLLAQALS